MKRPDIDFLQIAKRRLKYADKATQRDYFDTVLSCPLLWFGDKEYEDLWKEWHVPDVPVVTDTQEWSFDEFVLCYRNLGATSFRDTTDVWAYVCADPEKLSPQQKRAMGMEQSMEKEIKDVVRVYREMSTDFPNVFQFNLPDEHPGDLPKDQSVFIRVHVLDTVTGLHTAFGGYYLFDNYNHDAPSHSETYAFVPALGSLLAMLENFKDSPRDFNQNHKTSKLISEHVLGCCLKLMTYMKYGEKHAVEKFPAKEKKKAVGPLAEKRPWLNASGPHILLLDRLPSTQKPHQGGTHASPKPHRRRGHWKTLNHPRYRRHPQYQKKIFVKPSFVGPKQVSYEGNIYRLVDPLEDKL